MAVDYKSRMVSFRVTEEQYEELRRLCSAYGSGSVSDMARIAIMQMLTKPHPVQPVRPLDWRVDQLEQRIGRIEQLLKVEGSMVAAAAQGGDGAVSQGTNP